MKKYSKKDDRAIKDSTKTVETLDIILNRIAIY